MRVIPAAEHAIDADSIRKETGHTWKEWFKVLDDSGGPGAGRKALADTLIKSHGVDGWWAVTITVEYERERGLLEKDGRPRGYAICVTKSIKSETGRVYAAMTEERQLDRWLGPGTKLSLEPGGSLTNGDGNRATIAKVTPGKLLRLQWESVDGKGTEPVEIKLTPAAGKCGLVLTHERIGDRAAADGLRKAWGEALDALKRLAES